MAQKKESLKDLQIQQAKASMPYYQQLLQWAAQNAGLPALPQSPGIAGPMGQPAAQPPMTPNAGSATRFQGGGGGGFGMKPAGSSMDQLAGMRTQGQPMAGIQPMGGPPRPGAPGLSNAEVGIYGSNPADVYRLQQAEEDVNRQAEQRARLLQYRLGQQGMGNSATMAAALTRNEGDAMGQFANFRRSLAMNSGQEQERRMQMLMQYINGSQAMGAQGQNVYAQQQQINAQKPGLFDKLAPLASIFSFKPIGL